MIKKSSIILLASIILLSGCKKEASPDRPQQTHYVTEICISYKDSSTSESKRYQQADEMRPILNYLRQLRSLGAPSEDPEAVSGDEFTVQLNYSDGTQKVYRLRCGRFLKVDSTSWQLIDVSKSEALKKILSKLEESRNPRNPVPTWPGILY